MKLKEYKEGAGLATAPIRFIAVISGIEPRRNVLRGRCN